MDTPNLHIQASRLTRLLYGDRLLPHDWDALTPQEKDKWADCLGTIIDSVEEKYSEELREKEPELESGAEAYERLESRYDDKCNELANFHETYTDIIDDLKTRISDLEYDLDRAKEGSA